jgi:hypothetical protein
MNTLKTIKDNYHQYLVYWVSQTFAGSGTFRMLPRGKSTSIRKWMRKEVGDGRDLSCLRSQEKYDVCLNRLTEKLSKEERLCFGHAAKLMNLYVKELSSRSEVLGNTDSRHLLKHAHVPLDRIILDSFGHDFPECAHKIGLAKHPSIKSLSQKKYNQIQDSIRAAARTVGLPSIAYDLCWAIRKGEVASARLGMKRQKWSRF